MYGKGDRIKLKIPKLAKSQEDKLAERVGRRLWGFAERYREMYEITEKEKEQAEHMRGIAERYRRGGLVVGKGSEKVLEQKNDGIKDDWASSLKVGDKVRIKQFKERPHGWNTAGAMDCWMGKVCTIETISEYTVRLIDNEWVWSRDDFEPIDNLKVGDRVRIVSKGEGMKEWRREFSGVEFTIEHIDPEEIHLKGNQYWWKPEWLIKLPK